jgi:hypothetical protein
MKDELGLDDSEFRKRITSIRDRFEDDIAWHYTSRLVDYLTGPNRPLREFTSLNSLMTAIYRPGSYNAARFRKRETDRPIFFLVLQGLDLTLEEVDLGVVPSEITAAALRTTVGWIRPDGKGGANRELDDLQFQFLLSTLESPKASDESILTELQHRGIGHGTTPDARVLRTNSQDLMRPFGLLCLMLSEFKYDWEF